MNKQLLTLALISGMAVSSFAGTHTGDDKNKSSASSLMELPVLTEQDLEEIFKDMELDSSIKALEIASQTYQVFDKGNNLILEETVQFENSPSSEMKAFIRGSEFLMEKGDLVIYKVF